MQVLSRAAHLGTHAQAGVGVGRVLARRRRALPPCPMMRSSGAPNLGARRLDDDIVCRRSPLTCFARRTRAAAEREERPLRAPRGYQCARYRRCARRQAAGARQGRYGRPRMAPRDSARRQSALDRQAAPSRGFARVARESRPLARARANSRGSRARRMRIAQGSREAHADPRAEGPRARARGRRVSRESRARRPRAPRGTVERGSARENASSTERSLSGDTRFILVERLKSFNFSGGTNWSEERMSGR